MSRVSNDQPFSFSQARVGKALEGIGCKSRERFLLLWLFHVHLIQLRS
jgi:hypothetical protein